MAKVALLIGVSEYEPGLNGLPAAVKDVEAMRQVLQHPDMGDFPETDFIMLKNPDRQQMEEAIENLFAGRQRDDLLLLFFSGHGIKDVETGKFYLTTRQTRKNLQGDLVRATAVAANFIHDSMSRSRSKRQVVILDSCFSGAFADGLSAKDDGTINIQEQLGGEGRAILTSSTSTQPSFEEKGQDLSIYTRYLVEGIQTGAADYDRDGIVSIGELHDYAKKQVQAVKPTMKPEIYPGREGSSIRLAKAPIKDPHLLYRKRLEQLAGYGEFSDIPLDILDALRMRLGVSPEKANEIEGEILRDHRKYKQNWQLYYQQFSAAVAQQYPLTSESRDYLRAFQQLLELTDKDVEQIETHVLLQRGFSEQIHQTASATGAPPIPALQIPAPALPFQPMLSTSSSTFSRNATAARDSLSNRSFTSIFRSNTPLLIGFGGTAFVTIALLTGFALYHGLGQQNTNQQPQEASPLIQQPQVQDNPESDKSNAEITSNLGEQPKESLRETEAPIDTPSAGDLTKSQPSLSQEPLDSKTSKPTKRMCEDFEREVNKIRTEQKVKDELDKSGSTIRDDCLRLYRIEIPTT